MVQNQSPARRLRTPALAVTWHHRLVTGHALGGELVAEALAADQSVVLDGEGLVRQGAVAAETAEAVFVVVAVFVEQLLMEGGTDVKT